MVPSKITALSRTAIDVVGKIMALSITAIYGVGKITALLRTAIDGVGKIMGLFRTAFKGSRHKDKIAICRMHKAPQTLLLVGLCCVYKV